MLGSNTSDIRTGLQSPTLTTAEPVQACVPSDASGGGCSQSTGEQSLSLPEHIQHSAGCSSHSWLCFMQQNKAVIVTWGKTSCKDLTVRDASLTEMGIALAGGHMDPVLLCLLHHQELFYSHTCIHCMDIHLQPEQHFSITTLHQQSLCSS